MEERADIHPRRVARDVLLFRDFLYVVFDERDYTSPLGSLFKKMRTPPNPDTGQKQPQPSCSA